MSAFILPVFIRVSPTSVPLTRRRTQRYPPTSRPVTSAHFPPTNSSSPHEFHPIVPSHIPSRESSSDDISITPNLDESPPLTGGFGINDNGNGNGNNDDGGFDGEAEDDAFSDEQSLPKVLSENKATASDVPHEIMSAYESNLVTVTAIANYFAARANPISRLFLGIAPMRDRFLADRLFLFKILVEEGIGIFGKLSAEFQQRRADFWREGEFVTANVIMALLADFALVYFPAPSVSLVQGCNVSSNPLTAWISRLACTLPSNIFQTDRPYTLTQRAAGYILKASQLFAVGFLCCFTGVVVTNGLVMLRERVDPSYKPKTKKQNPFMMSFLYAIFLGLSSGTRYQLVNGVESHLFPRIFAKAPPIAEEVATFGLRYANTFWGSQQWVMFARLTNAQKRDSAEPLPAS